MHSTLDSGRLSSYTNSVSKYLKTVINRPQSPRQFFERIYGHLENSTNNNVVDVNKIKPISPLPSELSSSPDFIDRKHNIIDSSALENPIDVGFNIPHMGSMSFLPPGFNQFRPILGISDHHLPAGLTAFLNFAVANGYMSTMPYSPIIPGINLPTVHSTDTQYFGNDTIKSNDLLCHRPASQLSNISS